MATVNFIKYKRQSAGALSGVTQYVSQEEKIRDMDPVRGGSGFADGPLAVLGFLR